ncbi:SusC/RagA family TonB-linked outer membrane protein [Chitinophaga caseinilytica]|uniref:SusC/RagA family TonB-linked outer membrane protein n=1 Tax=Chitinophaga caseinilytica TaxID=2267521 RepID=UPI003C2BB74B
MHLQAFQKKNFPGAGEHSVPAARFRKKLTKLLLMKLAALLLIIGLEIPSLASSQNITMNERNVSLEKIFSRIEKQTGYSFWYNVKLLKQARRLDISVSNASLQDVLALCFKDQPLSYDIVDKVVVVNKKDEPAIVAPARIQVTGKVTDESGTPLPGVTIQVKGTKLGTSTDGNGGFTIQVPENSSKVLIFSFIGKEQREVALDGKTSLEVVLKPEIAQQQEVVVIGYGSVRKKTVTGAISSVKTADLNTAASTSIVQALAGRASGISAIQSSGQPGAGVNLQIRSNPSFASPGALYVVDGVIINDNPGEPSSSTRYGGSGVDRSPLNFINPNDIESIDFLKDASATSIYGARAGAGVVLITTKQGKGEKPKLEYDVNHSFQNVFKFYDILNTRGYMEERNKIGREKWMLDNKIAPYGTTDPSTVTPYIPKYTQTQIDTTSMKPNAVDAITRKGFTQQHNVSLSGMAGKTRYYVSGNYLNQQGVLEHSDYTRYGGRISLDQGISQHVKVGVSVIASGSKANNANVGTSQNEYSGMVLSAFYYPATMPLRAADGSYPINPDYQNSPNPLSFLEITDFTKSSRLLTSGYAEWTVIPELKVKYNYSYDQSSSKRNAYLPKSFLYGARSGGQASINEANSVSKLSELTVSYAKRFGEHNFQALAGHSYQVSDWDGLGLYNDRFPTDNFLFYNIGYGTAPRPGVSSYRNPSRIWKSYFGRVIYDFADKYILTLSLRRDGASNFAANKKWGTFPGVSAAWVISEEEFIKNQLPVVSFLKLRAGYGTTGNSNIGGSAFSYYTSNSPYVFGGTQQPGVTLQQLSNDDLSWETQRDINVGLDFQLFNNRIGGSFDYFNRTIVDLLTNIPLTTDFPVKTVAGNAGKTRSRGWDINLNTKNIVSNKEGGLNWSTTINLSHYFNSWVTRSPNALQSLPKYEAADGPFNAIYGYVSDGIFQGGKDVPKHMPGMLPGGIIVKDLNGYDASGNLTGKPDGQINSADRVLLGINGPEYSFGFNNTFSYRRFDLGIFMYGFIQKKYNSDMASSFSTYAQLGQFGWNVLSVAKERWSYDNTGSKYPTGLNDPYGSYASDSDYWLENANFLRCRDITLGYTFGHQLIAKQNLLTGLRLYANVQNPFIITKYKGIDPELQNYLAYPMSRSFTIGLNAKF